MKKYFASFLLLSILPGITFGASARYTQLVREKQRKMEQLEKCMGASKGLKIAGVSTLGLTAVGVAGNIAEANIIKNNESAIAKTDKKIEQTKQEIAEKQAEIADKKAQEQKKVIASRTLKNVAEQDIAEINSLGGNIGDKAIAHGYQPEQLPQNLSSKFATAMLGFINRCYGLKGQNGIETVSAGAKSETDWRSLTIGEYGEDKVLDNLNENIIAECKIETCVAATHIKQGNSCVEKSADCTSQAKQNDVHVVSAIKKNNKCEIQECEKGYGVNADKTACLINELQEISVSTCTADVLASLHASVGSAKESGCFVQKCVSGYHLELNGKTYTVEEYENMNFDSAMKCVPDKKQLSESEKIKCHADISRTFLYSGVPDKYQSKHGEYLNDLQNRVADKDGYISMEINGISSKCKKGQKWSECSGNISFLKAIANIYTQKYAENIECGDSNDLSINLYIENKQTAQDCTNGTVWSPSMQRCQDPETAAANAEFDRRLKECQKGGAAGYSIDKGCLCESEILQEWDGTKCVMKDTESINACKKSGGRWENAKCNCPGGPDEYDTGTKTCKRIEILRPELTGLTVAPVSAPEIKSVNIPTFSAQPAVVAQPTAMQQMLFAQ